MSCKEPLHTEFVDLAKVDDLIDQRILFEALVMVVGIPTELVKTLVLLFQRGVFVGYCRGPAVGVFFS